MGLPSPSLVIPAKPTFHTKGITRSARSDDVEGHGVGTRGPDVPTLCGPSAPPGEILDQTTPLAEPPILIDLS